MDIRSRIGDEGFAVLEEWDGLRGFKVRISNDFDGLMSDV